MTIANILSIDILNADERTFSVVTDWTDESGADWPTDDAIAAALSDELGRRVESVDFSGAGDDLDEAIYTWQDVALFVVTDRDAGATVVESRDLDWRFIVDADGAITHGIELAGRLADEGYDLAIWACAAEVGSSIRLPLA